MEGPVAVPRSEVALSQEVIHETHRWRALGASGAPTLLLVCCSVTRRADTWRPRAPRQRPGVHLASWHSSCPRGDATSVHCALSCRDKTRRSKERPSCWNDEASGQGSATRCWRAKPCSSGARAEPLTAKLPADARGSRHLSFGFHREVCPGLPRRPHTRALGVVSGSAPSR